MLNQLLHKLLPPSEIRFDIHQPDSQSAVAAGIVDIVSSSGTACRDFVILCIGTDRSTGDSLGPLTGSKLQSLVLYPHIFGTLDKPVHATNLAETLRLIQQTFAQPFVIAVDACLGRVDSIGFVTLGRGPLKPGAAVNKDLPSVGDVYITGTVNVGGFMEHLVLQSTRLSLVVKMADAIAYGLAVSLAQLSVVATKERTPGE
ncbi:MAG: spore protease YyaC [Negativicutes bacterium]|nr:spore protease YyaC [Negativicutes bacterium]